MGSGSERDTHGICLCLDDGRLAEMFQQRGNDPQFLEVLMGSLSKG